MAPPRSPRSCEASEHEGHWAEKASLMDLHRVSATQAERCRLRVTVQAASSAPDGGTKVKLLGVMMAESGGGGAVGNSRQVDTLALLNAESAAAA